MPTLRPCLPLAAALAACLPGPGPTDPDRPMPPIRAPERAQPVGARPPAQVILSPGRLRGSSSSTVTLSSLAPAARTKIGRAHV